ncbi:MAG: hypothetical protein EHM55_08350 [Acidobacteria bacterium]|nr:MAG: hypothetical protein EHM55_08350 [Acidobacteriota bacterium]
MQNDATVGRVLLASLHQAIAEVLPARLEFYERWLAPSSPGEETLGVASFMAVLAFLHEEGDASEAVATSAGHHAAVRSFRQLPPMKRAYLSVLPRPLRAQKVVRLAVGILPALYPESRVDMTRRGATVFINIDGSPFCDARGPDGPPSCGFYTGAISTFLRLFNLRASVKVSRCRASGSKSCLLMVLPDQMRSAAGAERSLPGLAPLISPTSVPDPIVPSAAVEIGVADADAADDRPAAPPEMAPSVGALARDDRAAIEARWEAIAMPSPGPRSKRDATN